MDKAIAFLVESSDLWMDGFHNNFGMIKTASILETVMLKIESPKFKLRYKILRGIMFF